MRINAPERTEHGTGHKSQKKSADQKQRPAAPNTGHSYASTAR